jgi:hypothetical protein
LTVEGLLHRGEASVPLVVMALGNVERPVAIIRDGLGVH